MGKSSIFLSINSSTPLLYFFLGILDRTVNIFSYRLSALPYKCSSISLMNFIVTGTSVAYYAVRLSIIIKNNLYNDRPRNVLCILKILRNGKDDFDEFRFKSQRVRLGMILLDQEHLQSINCNNKYRERNEGENVRGPYG